MSFKVAIGGDISDIEDGFYIAKLTEIKDTESTFNGETKPQKQLRYQVVEDPDHDEDEVNFVGEELLYWVNRKTDKDGNDIVNPKSNYYKVVKAHLGRDLDIGDEGDLEAFVDTLVRIQVERKTNTKGENRPYIVGFSAAPKKKSAVKRNPFE